MGAVAAGVLSDKKIPKQTLVKAAKASGLEGKRARLAETLEGFHKNKTKKVKDT